MPRSVTYGLTTSSVSRADSSSSAIASVIGRKRPGALWSTIAGAPSPGLRARGRARQLLDRHGAAEAAEAREHDELELRDDRPFEPEEEVVEAAVLEVVLHPGAADPADPAVDDEHLAVVDVPERVELPADRAAVVAERPEGPARLRAARHARLHAAGRQPVVELLRPALRVGAVPVDDHPHRHAVARLREQRLGEAVADRARAEAELDDVHRRRRALDVLEHPREEARPADEHLGRRRRALLEREREVAVPDLGRGEEPLGVRRELGVGDVHGSTHGAIMLETADTKEECGWVGSSGWEWWA